MSSDIAIKIENLSKCYQIYDTPRDRLKQFVVPRFQRLTRQMPKHYFREFWALKDISLEIKKGETVGIIGRNGSGKSTLLQLICGTLNPTAGSIQTNGRVAALLELGSGFNLEFSGRENVYMNAAVLGLRKEDVEERFDNIAAFADIGEFIEQPVKTYSSGMMVRLAFAVIAHVDADILVIDEALSVGDAFFVQKCMRFLRNFMKTGTVLLVSHDTGAVNNLCDHAILLTKGAVEKIGKTKEVCELYLKNLYESEQGKSVSIEISSSEDNDVYESMDYVDQRLRYINSSPYRNDIELFEFSPELSESFGKRGAKIINVWLTEAKGGKLSWVVGGELVTIHVLARAHQVVESPIIGFLLKDNLGQHLFGDTTYYEKFEKSERIIMKNGQLIEARFTFRMPLLSTGDYTVCAAVSEGTVNNHIVHHWLHDALFLKVHSSGVRYGLVGIPMLDVDLSLKDCC